jgi:tetratricopeptide (TPR) repeat protein
MKTARPPAAAKQNAGKPAQSHRPISRLAASLIIVCAILLVYGRVLFFGFTYLDDQSLVLDHYPFLHALSNIPKVFYTPSATGPGHSLLYRPLQTLSYMMDAQISGKQPFSYHAANLALHILCCLILYNLLLRLSFGPARSFFAALFFAVHPLFVPAICWIPARGDLLLCLFGLLSFNQFIAFVRTGGRISLIAHLGAFAGALFSKENAIILPAVFVVYGWLVRREYALSRIRTFVLLIAWVAVSVPFLVLRKIAIGSLPPGDQFGLSVLIANLPTIPELLTAFAAPFDLKVLPGFQSLTTAIGVFLLAALLVWTFTRRKDRKWDLIASGGMLFLLLSIPVMMFANTLGRDAYDFLYHRSYFPMAGLLVMLLTLVPPLKRNSLRIPLAAIVIAAISVRAIFFSSAYASPIAFYNAAIAGNPRSALAYNNRAMLLHQRKDSSGALRDCNRALQLKPDYPDALNNRATILTAMGQYKDALADIDRFISRASVPTFAAYTSRGNCKYALQDYAGALEDYGRAIALDSSKAKGYLNRANAEVAMQNLPAALSDYRKALATDPFYAEACNGAAVVFAQQSAFDSAYTLFDKALRLKPVYPDAYVNMGIARFNQSDTAGACAAWRKALQMGSSQAGGLLKNCRPSAIGD